MERRKAVVVNFLIDGPAPTNWGHDYIESKCCLIIKYYQTYTFTEIAKYTNKPMGNLYDFELPITLSMNLDETSGVFIDKRISSIKLPNGYSDQQFIKQISNDLQDDIVSAFEYGPASINFGYAHTSHLKTRFIWTTLQQSKQNTLIIVNRHGVFERYDYEEFVKVTMEDLKKYDIADLDFHSIIFLENGLVKKKRLNSRGRKLVHIVVREKFNPKDMTWLQLASDRLLATGDNSACESYAARCKLYMYEDVANCGCKDKFLKQQITVASIISTSLGRYIELAGKNKDFTAEEMKEYKSLLKIESLGQSTVEFCNYIIENYDFEDKLMKHFTNFLSLSLET